MHLKLLSVILFILSYVKSLKLSEEIQFENLSIGKGTFWQFTDIHWDLRYSENGDPNKMCHRNKSSGEYHNGYFGNYLCDAPWSLVQSAMLAMTKLQGKPDFILWTGDNAPHSYNPFPDYDVIFHTVSNLTEELRSRFPGIPIIPVLGNHDAFPVNDFPANNKTFYEQYLIKCGWTTILSEKARKEFSVGGYFSVRISSMLSVLSINTNLYIQNNKLGTKDADPTGQLAWMKAKLDVTRRNNEKVLVAAHSPPGFFERNSREPFFNETYNDPYINLLNKYGDVIVGQFYGHEHTDTFRIFNSTQGKGGVAFLAPSVTPWYPTGLHGGTAINPSIRLYSYNSSNILDYYQYQLNLTEANHNHTVKSFCYLGQTDDLCEKELLKLWQLYYKASITFSVPVLTVDGMTSFLQRLHLDDALLQKYYLINSAGVQHSRCDASCRQNFLCAVDHLLIDDFRLCMNSSDDNCNNNECLQTLLTAFNLLAAGIIATILLIIFLGVKLFFIVLARRKKTTLLVGSSPDLDLANRLRGYRTLEATI